MSHLASGGAITNYLNPVYPKSFPDPFVLKHNGSFFGYSTGFADDGNVFAVITSKDLVNWSEAGGAMKPLEPSPPFYWAPEITYSNGKFYLYYSVGNETFMEIRVAVSDRPDAGFLDSGHRLTSQDFAIDAHVFVDDDGSKFLFYATDFLEHTHIGTGTVVDRMLDWFALAGEPRPVTRARYDWQVYDPNRKEKGGVRWHTVEGPTVLKRKGIYYEMFSGGNWQNTTYGVSFATTDQIGKADEWNQFSDGEKVLPILRTEPDLIIGPGHNSVVRGPNNRELYCVYHRWTEAGRVLAIDRMDFTGNRIFVTGATHTPQPAPFLPSIRRIDQSTISNAQGWMIENGTAVSEAAGFAQLVLSDLPSSFLCEISMRCGELEHNDVSAGFHFATGEFSGSVILDPASHCLKVRQQAETIYELPPEFDWTAVHLLRLEVDVRILKIALDDRSVHGTHFLEDPVTAITLFSNKLALEISSFELTEGFEELFEGASEFASNGWRVNGEASYSVDSGELLIDPANDLKIAKHRPLGGCEFASNFRIVDDRKAVFGLVLRTEKDDMLRLSVDASTHSIDLNGEGIYIIPDSISLLEYHQLRIIKSGLQAHCYFDDVLIRSIVIADVEASASVYVNGGSIAIEMIRLTAI